MIINKTYYFVRFLTFLVLIFLIIAYSYLITKDCGEINRIPPLLIKYLWFESRV